jgi:hypothetical protein
MSSDVAGPGLLTGAAGSLLALLDACLVTSYAGHTLAAQWTKPIANAGNIGSYKQGAGAGLSLVINDAGPNGTSTYKEAWAIGWESVAGVGSPVGTGSGQFPIPAQLLTTGHVVWRKSATADAVGRAWVLAADSSTFYLWVATGDTVGVYYHAGFGDVFSLKGSSDAYRCFIYGRNIENTAVGHTTPYADQTDELLLVPNPNAVTVPIPGHFMARTYGGGGTSVTISRKGDLAASTYDGQTNAPYAAALTGAFQTPNGPDNSVYLCPLGVVESVAAAVRGRFRGLYQICHAAASFADGQTFSGGGDYAGKTFQVVKAGVNGGFWALETSATVETN